MDYLPLESAGCAGTNVTRLEDPARPFVPRGRGPDGEGAGLPASAPRGGAVPRARARRRGAGPPSPPPRPTHRPRRPPRAHTREPRRHANEVPERRGAWAGGRGAEGGAARGRAPPERTHHTCSCSRARCGARADLAPRGVGRGARARAQTPFLAAFAIRGPAPLIGHCPRRARPARSGPAGARLPGGEQRARVGGATRDTGCSPAPPNLAKHTIL